MCSSAAGQAIEPVTVSLQRVIETPVSIQMRVLIQKMRVLIQMSVREGARLEKGSDCLRRSSGLLRVMPGTRVIEAALGPSLACVRRLLEVRSQSLAPLGWAQPRGAT